MILGGNRMKRLIEGRMDGSEGRKKRRKAGKKGTMPPT
jgi:hypothetical protein